MKNINLRVRADGSIYVSAPFGMSAERADAFVCCKSKLIFKHLKNAEERNVRNRSVPKYEHGDHFKLLGKEITICLQEGECESVCLEGDRLRVVRKDKEDHAGRKKAVSEYLDRLARETLTEAVLRIWPLFKPFGIGLPQIRFRAMKTRWGSCTPQRNSISLNTMLGEKPVSCVEYIVLHEFCHFLQPNHSRAFYQLVEQFMPDWKERRRLLNDSLQD